MTDINSNYRCVIDRLQQAAKNAGRDSKNIVLLAVSKTKPLAMVEAVYKLGQRDFGENYLQDAIDKILTCQHSDIRWHFIGQIQSNKTKAIAEHFDWVQSIDRPKIAKRLAEQRPASKPPLQCCIQININEEQNKGGVDTLVDALALAKSVAEQEQLTLRGIMAIPENSDNTEVQRANFAKAKSLFDAIKLQFPSCDTLSMGMSGDLESAVFEGTTMVRIGTDIFGARS